MFTTAATTAAQQEHPTKTGLSQQATSTLAAKQQQTHLEAVTDRSWSQITTTSTFLPIKFFLELRTCLGLCLLLFRFGSFAKYSVRNASAHNRALTQPH